VFQLVPSSSSVTRIKGYTNTHCHNALESQAFITYIDSAKSNVLMTDRKFKIRMNLVNIVNTVMTCYSK